jgi:hypothetical protein
MVEARGIAAACLALAAFSTGCMPASLVPGEQLPDRVAAARGTGADAGAAADNGARGDNGASAARAPRVRETAAAHPLDVFANGSAAEAVRRRALAAGGTRIIVSTEGRSLWLMRGDEILFSAPIAVGMTEPFFWEGRRYDWETPIGERRVLAKSPNPIWVPPDWHYFEKAAERNLTPVHLRQGQRVQLSDGTRIEVRGNDVGRVNAHGNFWPFTPGMHIIFDDKIFVPPFGTRQRQIDEILGTHKLELGNGYLIHGTNDDGSIGDATSHGCVRMYNEDVQQLYRMTPVGTTVFIF